ncbi:hypothetical protein MKX01_006088 [Papaver californicum]|nr:hypothetical protein MKX01_006088 [Papaver californicum]
MDKHSNGGGGRLVPMKPFISLFVFILFIGFRVQYSSSLRGGKDISFRQLNRSSKLQGQSSLCSVLIEPSGYPCSEHSVKTDDGYVLALQRVSSDRNGHIKSKSFGPPILLQHGLFMGGDSWFLNSKEQSLGYILADQGFDVWVGNVRGTHWSHGHVSLSVENKEYWDWSWQELALYDLAEMIEYVHAITNSKVLVVGHSQGTVMSLAAFTRSDIVDMVEGAALLCPISYLSHCTAPLVLDMVRMHLDKTILALGIHQLNFRSERGVQIMDSICDERDCSDLLVSITGMNCCFNNSRVDDYLTYEPHPSSTKNLNHLFQKFNLADIPKSLPLWIGYGGKDALADVTDVKHTLKELKCSPELFYLEDYGHIDFLLSVSAKQDVYDSMIKFFRSLGATSDSS